VTTEEKKEATALLVKCVGLLNETMTASPERQVEIRREFDGIMNEINEIWLRNQN
jgi:hypothetical protein